MCSCLLISTLIISIITLPIFLDIPDSITSLVKKRYDAGKWLFFNTEKFRKRNNLKVKETKKFVVITLVIIEKKYISTRGHGHS